MRQGYHAIVRPQDAENMKMLLFGKGSAFDEGNLPSWLSWFVLLIRDLHQRRTYLLTKAEKEMSGPANSPLPIPVLKRTTCGTILQLFPVVGSCVWRGGQIGDPARRSSRFEPRLGQKKKKKAGKKKKVPTIIFLFESTTSGNFR